MGLFGGIGDVFENTIGSAFETLGIDNYIDSISAITSAIAEGDFEGALKEAAKLAVTAAVDYYTGGQFGETAGAMFEAGLEGKSLGEIGKAGVGALVEDVVGQYAGSEVGQMVAGTVTGMMEGESIDAALINSGGEAVAGFIEDQTGSEEFGKIAGKSLMATASGESVDQVIGDAGSSILQSYGNQSIGNLVAEQEDSD